MLKVITVILFSILMISCDNNLSNPAYFQWNKIEDSGDGPSTGANDIKTDSKGNIYFTGFLNSDFLQDNIHSEVFLAKYDKYGKEVWFKNWKEDKSNYGMGEKILIDKNDNIYVVGKTIDNSKRLFLSKLNTNGEFLWTKEYGDGSYYQISIDSKSNILLITKDSSSYRDQYEASFIKVNSNGKTVWSYKSLEDGANKFFPEEVVVDKDDNLYVSGTNSGNLDGSKNVNPECYSKETASYSMCQDIFLRKLDKEGNILWTKQFGTNDHDRMYKTLIYDDGLFVFFNKDTLIKFDLDGNILWEKNIGINVYDAVILDKKGNIYIGKGNISKDFLSKNNLEKDNLEKDFFLIKFDKNGKFLWLKGWETENDIISIRALTLKDNIMYMIGGDFLIFYHL